MGEAHAPLVAGEPLAAEDLQRLATAAYVLGRDDECAEALEAEDPDQDRSRRPRPVEGSNPTERPANEYMPFCRAVGAERRRSVAAFGALDGLGRADGSLLPFWYHSAVDLNIKDLDDGVGERLREQATAAGLSVQQYLRQELARIAARRSPAEFVAGREPMNRAEFERIRKRLRDIDAA